jgi:hypothetical protein
MYVHVGALELLRQRPVGGLFEGDERDVVPQLPLRSGEEQRNLLRPADVERGQNVDDAESVAHGSEEWNHGATWWANPIGGSGGWCLA